ncbi:MAG: prepilin-type N-terminal cleavage/methylation domain-containing protein [Gammaproteobacteria bacterium]|nr:prepilin-type N-terminal cleavage/methylation domain-containing protein [Gammaproteobacteria bacterium]
MNRQQAGFTLIELVVVILVLSILAAMALPRFIDVQSKAHEASVAGVGGAIGSGVALAHAQWIANGSTAAGLVAGFGSTGGDIYASVSGWPIDDSTATASCVGIWEGVLQAGAPTVGVAADTASAVTDYYVTTGSDGAATCTYTYTAVDSKNIQYITTSGEVTITK